METVEGEEQGAGVIGPRRLLWVGGTLFLLTSCSAGTSSDSIQAPPERRAEVQRPTMFDAGATHTAEIIPPDAGPNVPGWYCPTARNGPVCHRDLASCRAESGAGACAFTKEKWCFSIESSPPSRATPASVSLCHLSERDCGAHRDHLARYFTEPYPVSLKMRLTTDCAPEP